MASIKTKTPIVGGSYYHIFNRGTNRQNVFFTEDNYHYFLSLIGKYLMSHMHILAFSLLPNHFHLIVKIRDELTIQEEKHKMEPRAMRIIDETEIGKLASKQLGRLFISYAMAINKQENRVGNLFDPKFKRLEICEQEYLEYAIFYAHYNPEKHGYTKDFKNYKYSSYRAISGDKKTKISRELVCDIFEGKDDFLMYHAGVHNEINHVVLE